MASPKQESPKANQLWAGEIKLTVHVRKELTRSEEQRLTASLEDLAETFKTIAEDALPQICQIDLEIG